MASSRSDLPTGTVTFLFTDIEGSTRLLHDLGPEAYASALAEHRRLLRDAFARNGGVEVDTQGDAFFVAFPTAPGALAAARQAQAALDPGPIRVRMGTHTGTPIVAEEGYVGTDVHRAARIAAVGHGGQVLVSAATATLASDAALRDLGMHRLKDLSAPERIHQLEGGDFPALRTLYRTNFPIPVTPFLGRERELAEVVDLIGRPDVRLVTLTGPGGTGKTRLGSQAAGELADRYSGGVWWVPLAPLRDPGLVLESASQAVGASDGLAEHIGDTTMLILFDNFEQVVDAAPDVAAVLGACPNLDVVVTSREPLHVAGEHEYQVPPMAPSDGAELFLTRAHAVDPALQPSEAVDAICARLDELPLAIELAAARVKLLSPEKMLERLERRLPILTGGARDLPERQRTLRATIEWSYELLTPDEQRLFARLSVFRGGATLEAIEAVAEADLDTLQSLVDKSLVRRRADRFVMLETIREFAAEALEASGEADDLRRRHADFFVALAHEAEPHLRLDEIEWLDRLEAEQDNLRAVLDRLETAGDTQDVLDLAGALQRFWYLKAHPAEGRRRYERALAADSRPTAARAKALRGASVMALNLGGSGLAQAKAWAEEALALDRQLGDAWGAAYSTMMIGNALGDEQERNLAAAVPMLEAAMGAFEKLGDPLYTLMCMFNLGWMVDELGDRARGKALHEDSLRRARAIGNARMEAGALTQLAFYARDEGRLEESQRLYRQAIKIEHARGQLQDVGMDLSRLASVVVRGGRAREAAQLLGASAPIAESIGSQTPWWAARRDEETIALLREHLSQAELDAAVEEGRRLTVDEAVALALGSEEPVAQ